MIGGGARESDPGLVLEPGEHASGAWHPCASHRDESLPVLHSLARRNDGTVWAWGGGSWDQLGDGNTAGSPTPVQVSGLSRATAIAAGNYHSLAVRDDGTVWAWGGGWWGQLGDGTTTQAPTPVQVKDLTGATAVAGSDNHSLAVRNDGTVWGWGNNGVGQLGDPSTVQTFTPVQVHGVTGATAVAAAGTHSLAVHSCPRIESRLLQALPADAFHQRGHLKLYRHERPTSTTTVPASEG